MGETAVVCLHADETPCSLVRLRSSFFLLLVVIGGMFAKPAGM